jgi:hypothetical protein
LVKEMRLAGIDTIAAATYRQSTLKSLQKCPSKPPMADISIWQKTGHFYFALTDCFWTLSLQNENVRFVQSKNVRVHRWPRDCFWLYGLACSAMPLQDRRMCAPLNSLTPVRKCL